ncbi:MAG: hypothetical protein JO154_19720 [Chitinophaga sp.]|uniref:hypothetical protein n=1 Tax=Chitinophaga sp. TaxID=1869181 RepID=UPI0025C42091|nr:hypothetical protein [Chitinophaga sp.]MBV8254839.1 hypothetical protein [Chitinophaga sp.]
MSKTLLHVSDTKLDKAWFQLDYQKDKLLQHCTEQKIVDYEFNDLPITCLLPKIYSKAYDTILITRWDRLFLYRKEGMAFIRKLIRLGIKINAIQQRVDFNTESFPPSSLSMYFIQSDGYVRTERERFGGEYLKNTRLS